MGPVYKDGDHQRSVYEVNNGEIKVTRRTQGVDRTRMSKIFDPMDDDTAIFPSPGQDRGAFGQRVGDKVKGW